MVYLKLENKFDIKVNFQEGFNKLQKGIDFPISITKPIIEKYYTTDLMGKLEQSTNIENPKYQEYIEVIKTTLPEVTSVSNMFAKVEDGNVDKFISLINELLDVKILTNNEVIILNLQDVFNDITNAFSFAACSIFHRPLYWWDLLNDDLN